MRIASIETRSVSIPLAKPSKFALGIREKADHVIVRVHTDEEITGFGEVSPFSPFCSETRTSVVHCIEENFSPFLVSHDPFEVGKVSKTLDAIAFGNAFAKATIDMALYDLLGKKLGVPAYVLLGGKHQDRVLIAKPIGIGTLKETVEEAHKCLEEGFKATKVYVGLDTKEDVERVKAVRETVGSDILIKLDANQRWSPKTAIKMIRRMEKYDLLLVEQPVPRWDLEGLSIVRRSVETPIAVDESLFSPQDAMRIVKKEAADIFNIYVAKSGGLYRAKSILNIAESAGIPCLIGSLYELSVGTAAGAHLACSSDIVKYPCDLVGPIQHRYDIVDAPLETKDGFVRVPHGLGLGVGNLTDGTSFH